jgi:TonB family protein
MSHLPDTAPGLFRTELRNAAYARLMWKTLLVAVAFHLSAAVALNPSMLLRLFRPDVPLGYEGEPRRGELAPIGPDGKGKFTYFRVRRYTGPVRLTSYEPVGSVSQTGARSPTQGVPVAGNVGKSGPAERNVRGQSGGSGGPLVIELGEDFVVIQKTGALAQSEKFQAVKMVRPDYPPLAIRRGIEGLVRLRVEIDVEGTVIEVDVIENTSQDGSLQKAAVDAMRLWKFKPYRINQKAVPFTLIVPFRYRLVD